MRTIVRLLLPRNSIFLFVCLACLCAPLIVRYARLDPFRFDSQALVQNTAGLGLGATPIGPHWSMRYLLGADGQGRDVAARLLYGGRTSLGMAGAATLITLVLAGVLGVVAGALGGAVDAVLRWLLDLLWAFPVFLLAISLAAVLATAGLHIGRLTIDADSPVLPILILGVVFVPYVARPIRTQVLGLMTSEFVQAAVAIGGSRWHVIRRHIAPHAGATLLLYAPTIAAFDLLTEASLSVIGVGVQPPGVSWGTLIADGQTLIYTRPLVAIAPGLALIAAVLSLTAIADAMRKGAAS